MSAELSLFEPTRLSPPSIVMGAISAILGGGFMLLVLSSPACGVDLSAIDADDAPLIEEEVIAAHFIQLGRDFEQQLPNRIVPQAATAPPDSVAISETPRERPEPQEVEEEEPPPEDALEDPLQNLLDRVDNFAENTEQLELEGDPDGIEGGTTSAAEGDRYAGQIYAAFRRGWSIPETLGADEVRGLRVEVTLDIGEDLKLASFRLRGTSGNPEFDQSVVAQLERFIATNQTVPEPPPLERPRYIDQPFTLRFVGRDAS